MTGQGQGRATRRNPDAGQAAAQADPDPPPIDNDALLAAIQAANAAGGDDAAARNAAILAAVQQHNALVQAQAQLAAAQQQVNLQQQLLEAQQQLAQQAIAAQQAAQAAPPAAPVPAPAPVQLAFAPGRALEGIIDLSTPHGLKLHTAATAPLTPLYDGTQSKTFGFIQQVKTEVIERGWLSINQVVLNGTLVNWLDHFAEVTLEQLRASAQAHMDAGQRSAQNLVFMFTFLHHSLEPTFFARVAASHAEKYRINDEGIGTLFLKVILMDTGHDLRGTAATIRERLHNLPSYIVEYKFDIRAFNDFVNEQLSQLEARGEPSDALHFLFKAYDAVPDQKFRTFIDKKRDQLFDNEKVFSPRELMQIALNKSELMRGDNEWLKPSPAEEKIIALTAAIQAQREENEKLVMKHKQQRSDRAPIAAWRYKKGEPEVVKNGKTWIWCDHHEYYAFHTSDECKLGKKKATRGTDDTKPKPKPKPKPRATAPANDDDEDDDNDDNTKSQARAFLAISRAPMHC